MGEGESRLLDSLVLGAYKTTVQTATTDISRPTTKGECVGGWVGGFVPSSRKHGQERRI